MTLLAISVAALVFLLVEETSRRFLFRWLLRRSHLSSEAGLGAKV